MASKRRQVPITRARKRTVREVLNSEQQVVTSDGQKWKVGDLEARIAHLKRVVGEQEQERRDLAQQVIGLKGRVAAMEYALTLAYQNSLALKNQISFERQASRDSLALAG